MLPNTRKRRKFSSHMVFHQNKWSVSPPISKQMKDIWQLINLKVKNMPLQNINYFSLSQIQPLHQPPWQTHTKDMELEIAISPHPTLTHFALLGSFLPRKGVGVRWDKIFSPHLKVEQGWV